MKYIKIIVIIVIILALLPLFINLFVVMKSTNKIYENKRVDKTYDFGLVLGCAVHKDGTPSKMLKDRLDMAILLYREQKIKKIIISGDHSKGYSEVNVMYNYLINESIEESNIIRDDEGYSTSESLINYHEKYLDNSVILITQKYHLYRAIYISDRLKLKAIGVHAKKAQYFNQIGREFREILARNKDFFKFLFY